MNSIIKRKLFLIGVGIVLALIIVACSGSKKQDKDNKDNKENHTNMTALCEELFTFPSQNSDKILEEMANPGTVPSVGMGTEDEQNQQSGSIDDTLKEIYEQYFTEDGFQKFQEKRFPLNVLMEAQSKNCEMSLENVKQTKSSNEKENTEIFEAEILLNGNKVVQKIVSSSENGKITYFDFADQKLMEAIRALE